MGAVTGWVFYKLLKNGNSRGWQIPVRCGKHSLGIAWFERVFLREVPVIGTLEFFHSSSWAYLTLVSIYNPPIVSTTPTPENTPNHVEQEKY